MERAKEELLVMAAQQGNLDAFNVLYQHYQQPLLSFAYKVCSNEQIAQDAVQESWIKLSQQLRKLKDPRAFRSWLYRSVRWSCIDLVRKQPRNEQPLSEFDDLAAPCNIEHKESQHSSLLVHINKLPPLEKQAIYLFYLNEMTIAEISIILEIATGTVKSRLNRARNNLRALLEQE